jgi:hypothetical protein
LASSAGRQGACLLRSPTVLWKCPSSLPEPPPQTGNLVSEKDRHGSQRRQRLRGRPSRAATLAGARRLTRSHVGTRACLAPYAPSGALETNVRIGSLYSALTPGGAERVGLPRSGCLRLSIWKYQPTRMLSLCQEGFGWAFGSDAQPGWQWDRSRTRRSMARSRLQPRTIRCENRLDRVATEAARPQYRLWPRSGRSPPTRLRASTRRAPADTADSVSRSIIWAVDRSRPGRFRSRSTARAPYSGT